MSVVAGKRKSGKGQKCPSCGAITFQQYGQVFRCSACDARGWYEKAPPRLASEKGAWLGHAGASCAWPEPINPGGSNGVRG